MSARRTMGPSKSLRGAFGLRCGAFPAFDSGGTSADGGASGRLRGSLRWRRTLVLLSMGLAALRHQVLDDGAERERGNEGEGTDDHDRANEKRHKERRVRGKSAAGLRN